MKKTFLLLLISSFSVFVSAQRDNVWVFGAGTGLDFNLGSPAPYFSSGASSQEAAASVCDSAGQLLFYTQGNHIWNRTGMIMQNGDSLVPTYELFCNSARTQCDWLDPIASTVQGALIVPFPDDDSKYYLFSLSSIMSLDTIFNFPGRLYYSVVDMTLNGGNGGVVAGQKGMLIDSGFYKNEQMSSVVGSDCNIWVVLSPTTGAGDSVMFKSYKVDAGGLHATPVVSKAGIVPGSFIRGTSLSFSPDGTKLALTRDAIINGSVELYDFDPASGMVSNQRLLNPNLNAGYYGACFSPNSAKLYVSAFFGGIWQYDLSSNSLNTIINSAVSIDSLKNNIRRFTGLKLGPDGKIYYYGRSPKSLGVNERLPATVGVIHNPDMSGGSVMAVDSAIPISGTNVLGLPNVISVITPDTIYQAVDTLICQSNNSLGLGSSLDDAIYIWHDGDTSRIRMVSTSGTYWLRSTTYCQVRVDTFHVEHVNLSPVINVNEFELSTTRAYDAYQWYLNGTAIPGATNSTHLVTENGDYTVVVSAEGCTDTSEVYKVTNTAVPNVGLSHLVEVYPNPTQDILYISAPVPVGLEISTLEGRVIIRQSNASELSLGDLSAGIYLYKIADQHGRVVKVGKLIKSE